MAKRTKGNKRKRSVSQTNKARRRTQPQASSQQRPVPQAELVPEQHWQKAKTGTSAVPGVGGIVLKAAKNLGWNVLGNVIASAILPFIVAGFVAVWSVVSRPPIALLIVSEIAILAGIVVGFFTWRSGISIIRSALTDAGEEMISVVPTGTWQRNRLEKLIPSMTRAQVISLWLLYVILVLVLLLCGLRVADLLL